jgi:hypothetical protein
MFEHDSDGALVPIMRRLDPDRDAEIGGDPHPDRHLDATHGPA